MVQRNVPTLSCSLLAHLLTLLTLLTALTYLLYTCSQVLTIHCPPGVMPGQQIPVQVPPQQPRMQQMQQMQQMQPQMQPQQQMQAEPPVVMGAVIAGQGMPTQGGAPPVAMAMPMQQQGGQGGPPVAMAQGKLM